ncbi:pyruvate kinase [Methanothermococcus okinawensis]|uniref:Pyruvate kinase n=1 Tax=Methanothermococcus okinawensis (strain DSM 14208 / JCM 11175 / IH1) TaxID=647113 RepID=F8ANX1_METOI|nr:pyruvate kinase [Methanothermococcus okinawensis]AEH07112.1 pyruvate kinase [Methanothermococcus okinawensis IH1]
MKNLERKTKILITMGPSVENKLKDAVKLIDGIRFNMSHTNVEYIKKYLNILEKNNIAKLMDLKGNKIRIKKTFKSVFKTGDELVIGRDIILTYHPKDETEEEHFILINDGRIKLKVKKVENDLIYTEVLVGGIIKEGMGVNLPDTHLKMPIISDEDINNIKFAVEHDFEYIALSFVRNKNDIINLRDILNRYDKNNATSIIAKIETKEGLKNIEEIAKYSDGIMVARGDLGVEIPIEYIPIEQKNIINITNKKGKLTITATQMLDSMVSNPYPTRAEITDIANAIFDGTDCLMLSNETAVGKYPIEAINVMDKVARISENNMEKFAVETHLDGSSISTGIAHATHTLYLKLNPKIIITPTWSGKSATLISKFKPKVPIIALTPNMKTFKKLKLVWGVVPYHVDEVNNMDNILEISNKIAESFIDKGIYITTLGHPMGEKKTNVIKVGVINDSCKRN